MAGKKKVPPARRATAEKTPEKGKSRRGNGKAEIVTLRLPSRLFERAKEVRDEIVATHRMFPTGNTEIASAMIDTFLLPFEESAQAKKEEKERLAEVERARVAASLANPTRR